MAITPENINKILEQKQSELEFKARAIEKDIDAKFLNNPNDLVYYLNYDQESLKIANILKSIYENAGWVVTIQTKSNGWHGSSKIEIRFAPK